jgi:hypothetical protein
MVIKLPTDFDTASDEVKRRSIDKHTDAMNIAARVVNHHHTT